VKRAVNTIVVCGQGPLTLPRDAGRRVRAAVRALTSAYPAATWLLAGARGADELAARALYSLGARVIFVLALPATLQAAHWSRRRRATLARHLRRAHATEVLSSCEHPTDYEDRDREVVSRADLMVSFWDGYPIGRTADLVRLATARGLPVLWVPML
jgi:hypothetical protein